MQEARALQQGAGYAEYQERRVVVEHRLARLVHLGIRQSRYFGRAKTKFQLYLAATVANLTLVAGNSDGRARPVAVQTTAALSVRRPFLPSSISSRRGPVNFDTGLACADLTVEIHLAEQGFPAKFLGPVDIQISSPHRRIINQGTSSGPREVKRRLRRLRQLPMRRRTCSPAGPT